MPDAKPLSGWTGKAGLRNTGAQMGARMTAEPGTIDSGRILSRGFAALGRNLAAFFGLALVLAGLPTFVIQYWGLDLFGEGDSGASLRTLGMLAVSTVPAALLEGILVRETALYLAGRSPRPGASLAIGLQLFLPILAISLLATIGIIVGLVLLIVPGVIVYIVTIVAIPALVEERGGVFASLRRSFRLTRGSYLQIFVLLVMYAIFAAAVSTLFGLLFGVRNFGWDDADLLMTALASGLGTTVISTVEAVMVASLYIELRTVREGVTADDLASIFA